MYKITPQYRGGLEGRAVKIYTIMVMTDLGKDEETGLPDFGSRSLPGWFANFEDAYEAVSENRCDINEAYYQYALIEECVEGLYHSAVKRWWFDFDQEAGQYHEVDEPEFCKHYCGFTVG